MVALHRVSAKAIEALSSGKYADGRGLWLHRRADGGGQWFLRVLFMAVVERWVLAALTTKALLRFARKQQRGKLAKLGTDQFKAQEKERREIPKDLRVLNDVAQDALEIRKAD